MSAERSRREVLLALALGAGGRERRLLPDRRSGIDRRTVDAQVDVEPRLGVSGQLVAAGRAIRQGAGCSSVCVRADGDRALTRRAARLARWQDRHVVVTGAGRGIGKAIALRLARDGARLSLLRARRGRARANRRRDRRRLRPRGRHPRRATGRRRVRRSGRRERPDPRARREQRHRRAERAGRRATASSTSSQTNLVGTYQLRSRRAALARARARPPRHRRDLVDPRAHPVPGYTGLQRVEGRPPRARSLARRRARRRERAGERDLPRLGRHGHGLGGHRPDGRGDGHQHATRRYATGDARGAAPAHGRSRRTSPARSRGYSRPTRAASPGRRSTRTAARSCC